MRNNMLIGILLLILGGFALMYDHISYTKERKNVGIGPFRIQTEEREHIPVPPIVGGLLIIAGVVILFTGLRKR